jgi:hypothetical protein
MAYVTETLIEAEFKDIDFTASSAVTTTDITEFITQEEAMLNAQLNTVYSVPIASASSPIAFNVCRLAATLFVKARILDILYVKSNTEADQENTGDAVRLVAQGMIDKILDKTMLLYDATLAESNGGVRSYGSENDYEAKFTMDDDQW